MRHLVLAFADIVLHRRGPDELPASWFLFSLIFIIYLAVGLIAPQLSEPAERLVEFQILGAMVNLGFAEQFIAETFFYLAFIWAVLRVSNHSRRFLQTAIALIGTTTLLSVLGLPILAWIDAVRSSGGTPTAGIFFYIFLFLWSLDVAGFVLSRALQVTYFVGVLIVIGYFIPTFTLREYFFPVTG